MSSSQASTSHHGMATTFLASSAGTTSSHLVTSLICESYVALAFANILSWITFNRSETVLSIPSSKMGFLAPVSRRTDRVWFFARSFGPISRRRGTPCQQKQNCMRERKVARKNNHLLFPIIELVPRRVTLPQIRVGPNTSLPQRLREIFTSRVNIRALLICRTCGDTTRNNNDLNACHTRGKDQSLVVTMDHHHNTDDSRRETPRVLPDIGLRAVIRILHEDVEHLRPGKVLSQTVRCCSLDTTSSGRDETFDSRGVKPTSKFLFLRLDSWDDGHGEEVFVDLTVEVEDFSDFNVSFCLCQMGGVAFLPEEFPGAEEGFCIMVRT